MASNAKGDAFSQFDELLAQVGPGESPWFEDAFVADLDLFRRLLSIPIAAGDKQESGRPAKAVDAWIARELRRSGFSKDAVWPRTRRPRVLPEGLHELEHNLAQLTAQLDKLEQAQGQRVKADLRRAIRTAADTNLGEAAAYILGDFYAKQIDVGMSSWRRGPDILISTKTQFSAYGKNLKNRHEEAVGEVSSLRRRHPMAAMGFVYLVRRNIFDEDGAFTVLQNILTRLRRPGEAFDATMLLIADWEDNDLDAGVAQVDQPAEELSASRFFTEIIDAVTDRTPYREHLDVRLKRHGQPAGGLPDTEEEFEDLDSPDS